MSTPNTIPALLEAFERHRVALKKHAAKSGRFRELALTDAYRMAGAFTAAERRDLNDLARRISEGGLSTDQFLARSFAPLIALGEDHLELLANVRRGMTLQAFQSPQQKTRHACLDHPVKEPPEPRPERPIEEQLAYYREQLALMRIRLRDEHQARQAADRRADEAMAEVKLLRKTIAALQRSCKTIEHRIAIVSA